MGVAVRTDDAVAAAGLPVARQKQALQALSLAMLVEGRLREVPAMRSAIEQDPTFAVRIGQPRAHERDSRGRNWDIMAFQTGFLCWPQGATEFRAIVDSLREVYDLG
jgi:hypothetical protein